MRSSTPSAATRPAHGAAADSLLAGLVGRGIQGSRSPGLHMQEAQAQGFKLAYTLFDLDAPPWEGAALAEVIHGAESGGLAGVNVTYPFKQDVIGLLHELSPDAERLGAVNTVIFRDGRRVGHNTDWSGFAESLARGLPGCPKQQVVQLGAGGAGSAVSYALLHEGVGRLTLFDTDGARATDLADKLRRLFGADRVAVGEDLALALATADGLVNTTPVGMAKHPGLPAPAALLRPELWVADIVYVPIETQLLSAARARGCRVLDGGGMAVFQAADAFRLFTGREPDADRMRASFQRAVGQGAAPNIHE
jgi:shikimate dehydrogenase